jgi:hypothetical protein
VTLKHIHTRERADGLKETVVSIESADLRDKLVRLHKLCGEICGGPPEAIVVLTAMLDIYKQHTETSSAVITENMPQ